MKNKTLSITTLLLTGALLFSGCGKTNTTENTTSDSNTSAVESPEPELEQEVESEVPENTVTDNGTFSSLNTTDINGNAIDSSIFANNKITLVNVWNIGCTPCINEIPDLDQLNSDYAEKGAAILGLYNDFGMGIPDDEMEQIQDVLKNANASYTHLRIDGSLASDEMLLNMMTFPTTYIVDSKGAILETIEGSNNYEGWKAVIDSYLE